MSYSDLWMRDTLLTYGFIVAFVAAAVFFFAKKWEKFRKDSYRKHLISFEIDCAELASSHKKKLFKSLRELESHDPVLRSMKSIRLLEIGVKTGENIQFYPKDTRFIAVDWNLKLKEYLQAGNNAKQFSHVQVERVIFGDGSFLRDVATGSVDVVVTTRSLCSARSVEATLKEIRRVLAPGGQYLFMEHVIEKDSIFVKWFQKLLSCSFLWPSLYGDCRLDLDITKDIENAGFKRITLKPLILVGEVSNPLHLLLSKYHIIGTAIR